MIHIPYDPDFDTPPTQHIPTGGSNGFFHNASPKFTFIFGLVLGLALVSFAGILILLL